MRNDVVGGKHQRQRFTVADFRLVNIHDSLIPPQTTIRDVLDDFIFETVHTRLNAAEKDVRMIMIHPALREVNHSFYMNITNQPNPGEMIISFIERFAQSNQNIRSTDSMHFEFWIK